jgi:NADH-quinone oxidoreductase subunit J
MVLFLFIIMLMNLNADTEPRKHIVTRIIAGCIGGVLLFVMVGALKGAEQLQLVQGGSSQIGLVKNLGKVLFTEFLFPFEIASILLLSALVGAIMIGKREKTVEEIEN